MTLLPSVLVADVHEGKAEEIIKLVTRIEDISNEIQNGIPCFKWRIDNKYYQTEVNFCSANLQTTFLEEFRNSVEAVILHFDVTQENCIDDLNNWLTYLETFTITEKILLCRTCNGLDEIKKDTVNNWCVKNEYELVILEPEVEDSDDSFPETTGVDRIHEILNSHQWPNLIRKEKIAHNIDLSNIEHVEENVIKTQVFENSSNAKNQNKDESQVDEEEFENMEQLAIIFKNLASMKSEMSSLTTEQKLDQAEKVVKAFWNAVGGDSDEFSDSDNENVVS